MEIVNNLKIEKRYKTLKDIDFHECFMFEDNSVIDDIYMKLNPKDLHMYNNDICILLCLDDCSLIEVDYCDENFDYYNNTPVRIVETELHVTNFVD